MHALYCTLAVVRLLQQSAQAPKQLHCTGHWLAAERPSERHDGANALWSVDWSVDFPREERWFAQPWRANKASAAFQSLSSSSSLLSVFSC
jgi:hypothetical protein